MRKKKELPELLWPGKYVDGQLRQSIFQPLTLTTLEKHGHFNSNCLFYGDNLDVMGNLLAEMAGQIDLIYLDPPFATGNDFFATLEIGEHRQTASKKRASIKKKVYQDSWQSLGHYLSMLYDRLSLAYELLADTGSIFVHCDWRTSAYIRLIMDEIFGLNRFVNEIIWSYKSGGAGSRRFSRKHDTILFYSKTRHYQFYPQSEKSYNRALKPYRFAGVTEFEDEIGWYTMVNRRDVWTIDMVGRTASERLEYATQKPEALLSIILQACSKPGDRVADFFCGSGTTLATAEKLGRKWVGCDSSAVSIHTVRKRLLSLQKNKGFEIKGTENMLEQSNIKHGFTCDEILCLTTKKVELKLIVTYSEKKQYQIKLLNFAYFNKPDDIQLVLEDWTNWIDYWAVDWNFEKQQGFAPQYFNYRNRKQRELSLESEFTTITTGTIGVDIIDILCQQHRFVFSLLNKNRVVGND